MFARMNARIHAGEYVEFMKPKIDKSQKVRKIIAPEVIMSGSHQRPSTSSSGNLPQIRAASYNAFPAVRPPR